MRENYTNDYMIAAQLKDDQSAVRRRAMAGP